MAESAATAGAQCTLCTATGSGWNWQNALSGMVSVTASAWRACVNPDKSNHAGLGIVTADEHWHDILHWHDHRCFTNPVWRQPQTGARAPRVSFNNARLELAVLSTSAGSATGGRRS